MRVSVFIGDIAAVNAEAICTSTNPRLTLVMGTGAAVRDRGGFSILRACEALVANGPLPVGSAHVTPAGDLPAKIIIHCVASDTNHRSSPAIVRACVLNALKRATEAGCRTVAMPVFATGHAHVPFKTALQTMREAFDSAATDVEEVTVVLQEADREDEARHILCSTPRA